MVERIVRVELEGQRSLRGFVAEAESAAEIHTKSSVRQAGYGISAGVAEFTRQRRGEGSGIEVREARRIDRQARGLSAQRTANGTAAAEV